MKKSERAILYRSRFWRLLRKEVLELNNNQCQLCGTSSRLSIHHKVPFKTDEDFFKVSIDDLECLCVLCHNGQHSHSRRDDDWWKYANQSRVSGGYKQ